MKKNSKVLLICFFLVGYSCNSSVIMNFSNEDSGQSIAQKNVAPTTSDFTISNGYRDMETTIVLSYTDSAIATSCSISDLSSLIETTACTCLSGVCSVGVTAIPGYTGGVSFSYTVAKNGEVSNDSTVSFIIDNLGASNTDEWIKVPANAGGMGLSEFYVMKYEAKAWSDASVIGVIEPGEVDTDGQGAAVGLNLPVSIPDNQPWRNINANDAAAECESLGANYHLISNPEWMAIARDIENVDLNWTGQSVGVGCLYRGNSGEATSGGGTVDGDSCGYNGANPEEGVGRDIRARHILSNGAEIFDLSGNVWEWTDWDANTAGFQIGPTSCPASVVELPSVACGALADADYNTINGLYTSADGIGQINGDTGGGARRGGSWNFTTGDGVFTLHLNLAPTSTSQFFGFRCVYRP